MPRSKTILGFALLVAAGTADGQGFRQHLSVSSYSMSGADVTSINNAYPTASYVIYDFGIGSGGAYSASNLSQVQAAQAAGLKVFGYVPTYYGCTTNPPSPASGDCYTPQPTFSRTLAGIEGYVDQWYNWYHPDGILFDETSKFPTLQTFYQTLHDYVKGKAGGAGVTGVSIILNAAGYQRYEGIMLLGDVVSVWENSCANLPSYTQPAWVTDVYDPSNPHTYPPSRKMEDIYDCATTADMQTAVAATRNQNIGNIYIQSAGSVYNALPSYWSAEVSQVASLSSPALLATLSDSFAGVALDAALWNQTSSAGTITESNGALNMAPQANTGTSRLFTTSKNTYSLVGSKAQVQVLSVVNSGSANNQFVVQADTSNSLEWWYERGILAAYYTVAGVRTTVASLAYSPVNHAWWRIRESGGTVYWETSRNGNTWSQQGAVADSSLFALTSVSGALTTATYGTGMASPGVARYANFNVPARPPTATLTDAFASSSVDSTLWVVGTTSGTATEGGGSLSLTPNSNTGSAYETVTSSQTYSLLDSQASVRVPSVVNVGNLNNKFTLQKDYNNSLQWWFEQGVLYAFYTQAGTRTTVASFTYSASTHARWRIREASGTVYWETSPDGASWTSAGSVATSALFPLTALTVGFDVKTYSTGSSSPGSARYSYLNL